MSDVRAGESANVEFCGIIEQFVTGVVGLSSQYGSDNAISYSACNVIGKPTVFPSYGDHTQTFALRTYGPWKLCCCDLTPAWPTSQDFHVVSQDFLDVIFERSVFPFRLNIYETYNPGAVVRILAQDIAKNRWAVLWCGIPENVPSECSRIFSPPLRRIDFKTNVLRLEIYRSHLPYHYELDAVCLIGSSLISFLLHSLCDPPITGQELQNPAVDGLTLNKLPGELLGIIIRMLDLQSLCRCACVSRAFRKFCYDPSLYRSLNLQPYWHKVNNSALRGLANRCLGIRNLTLNWCTVDPPIFVWFLGVCGGSLRSLQLSCCRFLNGECIKALADFCPLLEELGLQSVQPEDQMSFIHISHLSRMHHLDLCRSVVDTLSLSHILGSCTQLESLGLGSCLIAGDQVAMEICRHLGRLRSLDLWRCKSLSGVGVRALAEGCPLLEELDLGWCLEVDAGSGCLRELLARCSQMKTLLLTSISRTLSNDDLAAISCCCPHLERLDVLGSCEIDEDFIFGILSRCRKLKLLDVSFCERIEESTVERWRECFPGVDIKRSFQASFSK